MVWASRIVKEKSRTYVFPSAAVTFKNVVQLTVRSSGTCRLTTADGQLHIVRDPWLTISIEDDRHDWTARTNTAGVQDNPGWTHLVA